MKRVIQVGVGGFGAWWRRMISESELVEYSAIVDTNPDTLEAARAELGLAANQAFTDCREAFGQVKADFALIVVPPYHHREVALAAFECGLPVLSEKPIADTWEASRDIVEGAERAGLLLAISQNYRYQPWAQTMRRVLAAGRLGRVDHGVLEYRLNVTDWGEFRHKIPDPLLVEMSVHHFDLMRAILGRDIEEVMAYTWNPGWNDYAGDCAGALLVKMEGGPTVLYEASVADRGSQTGWNGFWRIECEQGALQYRGQSVEIARFDAQQPEPVPPADLPAQGQHEVLRQFTSALAGGPAPETVGRDNLKSLAAVFAALESARSGGPKKLGELLG